MQDIAPFHIQARGKLLISGEYFVLDGALALAVPTKRGQQLKVDINTGIDFILWKSLDYKGKPWFEASFSMPGFEVISSSDSEVGIQLQRILLAALSMKKGIVPFPPGLEVTTALEFPREWGLGSSSTLIAAIASWLEVDAFELLWKSFGGSGYDIACALANGPLLYQIKDNKPVVQNCSFNPGFKEHLFFVYLGKKQSSREAIQNYRAKGKISNALIAEVSDLTNAMLEANTQTSFDNVIRSHEDLVSRELGLTKVKDIYFKAFPGTIKSLGAWGGDFVLVSSPLSQSETQSWFFNRGFEVVIGYSEMMIS
jgi:mevalonate kinase